MRRQCYLSQVAYGLDFLKSIYSYLVGSTLSRIAAKNISLIGVAVIPSPDIQALVIAKSKNLASTTISLGFASYVTWDLKPLVDDVIDWLNSPLLSDRSKVGILSSSQFMDLIRPYFDKSTSTEFQCMIYAITLAFTQPTSPHKHYLNVLELQQIGSMAGHNFLGVLEERLKPQSLKDYLAKHSKDYLQALFLLVVGTILAVGYTEPGSDVLGISNTVSASTPTVL